MIVSRFHDPNRRLSWWWIFFTYLGDTYILHLQKYKGETIHLLTWPMAKLYIYFLGITYLVGRISRSNFKLFFFRVHWLSEFAGHPSNYLLSLKQQKKHTTGPGWLVFVDSLERTKAALLDVWSKALVRQRKSGWKIYQLPSIQSNFSMHESPSS